MIALPGYLPMIPSWSNLLKESTLPLSLITAKRAKRILKRFSIRRIMHYINIAIPINPDLPGKRP